MKIKKYYIAKKNANHPKKQSDGEINRREETFIS